MAQAELIIYSGKDKNVEDQVFGLFPGENVVGLNKKKCQVTVDKHIKLDDQHCMISIDDGEYTIEDLKSQSGTYKVNQSGKQIKLKPNKAYDLGSEDEEKTFYLGQYKCVLRKPIDNQKNGGKQQKKKNIKINIHSDNNNNNIEEDVDEEYTTKKNSKKGEDVLQFTKSFKKKAISSKNNKLSSLEQEEESSKLSNKKGKGKQASQRAATQEYDDYYDYGKEADNQEIPTLYQESQENQLNFSQKGAKKNSKKQDKDIEKNLKLKEQTDEQWEKNKKSVQQSKKKEEEKTSSKKKINEKVITNLLTKYTGKKASVQEDENSSSKQKNKKNNLKKSAEIVNIPLAERLKIIHQSQFLQTQEEIDSDLASEIEEEKEEQKTKGKKGGKKEKKEPIMKKTSSNESLKGEELIMNLKGKIKKNLNQKKEEQQKDNKSKKNLKRKQVELTEEEQEYVEDQVKSKKKGKKEKEEEKTKKNVKKAKNVKKQMEVEQQVQQEEEDELNSEEEEEEIQEQKTSKKQKLNSGKGKKVQKEDKSGKKDAQKKPLKKEQKLEEKKGKKLEKSVQNLKEAKIKGADKDTILPKRNLFKVLLSNCALSDKEMKGMKNLGIQFVNTIKDNFNILIMENFRRRAKVLVAINSGAYVLSKKWVSDSIKKNVLQTPEKYILKVDKKDQDLHKFDLEKSINISQTSSDRVFEGQTFQVPADAGFDISNEEIRQIVESGGGKLVQHSKHDAILLINEKNEDAQKKYVENNESQNPVYSQEYILTGSLRQEKIDPEEYQLGIQKKKKGKAGKKQKK